MLTRVLADEKEIARGGLDEVAVSASIAGVIPLLMSAVPTAPVTEPDADHAYLSRLAKLSDYLDGRAQRHRDALADGRTPTALGVRQAIAQLDAYRILTSL